jgi:predicted nucleic acid-binding Zn ribbon protein
MPFFALKKVVQRVLREYNFTEDIDAYRVFSVWKDIVGEKMADHTKPVRINERVLYVEVDDPLWLTQLKYMKVDILNKIDMRIKKGVLKDVRFYLKGF